MRKVLLLANADPCIGLWTAWGQTLPLVEIVVHLANIALLLSDGVTMGPIVTNPKTLAISPSGHGGKFALPCHGLDDHLGLGQCWEDGLGADEGHMQYDVPALWLVQETSHGQCTAQCTMHNAHNQNMSMHNAQCTQPKHCNAQGTMHTTPNMLLQCKLQCNIEQTMTEHANATMDANTHETMQCHVHAFFQ